MGFADHTTWWLIKEARSLDVSQRPTACSTILAVLVIDVLQGLAARGPINKSKGVAHCLNNSHLSQLAPNCFLVLLGRRAAAGFGSKMPLYLIKKAGMYEDVCEGLARGHLQRGDQTSALVASEWYMRNNHFPGWARPYEFASELFQQLKRGEEARDMARFALRLPW